jgi:hypothetical protein
MNPDLFSTYGDLQDICEDRWWDKGELLDVLRKNLGLDSECCAAGAYIFSAILAYFDFIDLKALFRPFSWKSFSESIDLLLYFSFISSLCEYKVNILGTEVSFAFYS